jgi:glycosyltransferase involved in cell wall biosynthesis
MNKATPLRLLAYTDSATVGGAELVLSYLLGALDPEIEVGVLATDEQVARAIAAARPGAPAVTVRPPRGTGDHAALREHARAVRGFSPHVLHANQAWPWACAYGEIAGLLSPGTKVLAVDHLPVAGAVRRARRLGRRLLASRLQAHVAVGERAARQVEEIVGLAPGSVGSAPNGVPIEPFEAVRSRESGLVVGSLGRLTEQKCYALLVRALPALPAAKLVLVGDGPERVSLEALASELGVADRLTVTGWVSDARSRLREFDVFALPSGWEGMPLGILEAMHAGLPVLATDVGSVREVVEDGKTGFLVSPGDLDRVRGSLEELLADHALRARMGALGRTIARERFTDTAMAACYEAIYSEMVGWWRPRRERSASFG